MVFRVNQLPELFARTVRDRFDQVGDFTAVQGAEQIADLAGVTRVECLGDEFQLGF